MSSTMAVGAPASLTQTIIANGASLSAAVDMGTFRLARLAFPAAWTTADVTFQVSHEGTTFNDLYDAAGNEYTVKAAASRSVIIPLVDWLGVRFVKVRSGTSGSPVNQGADRTVFLVLVP